MAAARNPSPTRAPRTLTAILPLFLALLLAAPALQAIARAKDGDTIEGKAALMFCSSIGDLSVEGNTVSDTSDTTEDSRE